MKSKDMFTIIKQIWKGGFLVFNKCIVEYDSNSDDPIDSRIKRIETGEYAGTLISDEVLLVKKSDDDDLDNVIRIYFGRVAEVIMYCQHQQEVTSEYIREIFDKASDAWSKRAGALKDYKIIYQGPNIPIRIPDIPYLEICNDDFSVFGIEYEKWTLDGCDMENGTIYRLHGMFRVDDTYIDKTHFKTFEFVDAKDDITRIIMAVPETGFIDNRTFNVLGFYHDVELDIFFRINHADTDSWYLEVLLIVSESEFICQKGRLK